MGADLVGHICVGPKEPSAESVKKAREHVAKVLAQFEEARAFIKKAGDDDVADAIEKRFPAVVEVAKQAGFDDIVVFTEMDIAGTYTADEFVIEFLNMWDGRDLYRDVMSRCFIDPQNGAVDRDYQILVAGERTWGDDPDPDSGWWFCEHASWLGIMEILGIY